MGFALFGFPWGRVLLESIVVGLYSVVLTFFLPFKKNFYMILFADGFLKHLTGYYYQLHTYFCNQGRACQERKGYDKTKTYSADMSFSELIMESTLEGILFLAIGSLVALWIPNVNKYALVFGIAFSLHWLFECTGVHTYYCNTHCALV